MDQSIDQKVSFWPVMTAIFFGSFVAILSISSVSIALPVFSEHFVSPISTVQWTLTGFMLSTGTIAPVTGYLSSRFGIKRLYVLALIGFVLASLLCASAWNIGSLIGFRFLQGAFSGMIMPVTMTIIFQTFARDRQPFALSLWSLSAMLGPAIGPTLGGWLVETLNWRWLFLINLPVGLLAIIAVIRLLPANRIEGRRKFDAFGLLTVITGSLALLLAFSEGHNWGWTSGRILGLFAAGAVLIALFIRSELRTKEPLLEVRVLRHGTFSLTLVIYCLITASLYSGTFLTPLFLQTVQHASALDSGLVLLPASLLMAAMMPVTGKLITRIDTRWLVLGGTVLITVGTWFMGRLTPDTARSYIMIWMSVRNLGIALASTPVNNAGMRVIPRALSGHASATSNWVRQGFAAFAVGLFSSLLASNLTQHLNEQGGQAPLRSAAYASAYTSAIDDVFYVAAGIAAVGIVLSFFIRPEQQNKPAAG